MVKFLLHCLKFYYPKTLAYLLVYDIPFILNAAWKLIKSWLDPAAQKMIIFVGKTTIQQYIAVDNLPKHMGGNVTIIYRHYQSTLSRMNLCLQWTNWRVVSATVHR